jgi:hypothetical protein
MNLRWKAMDIIDSILDYLSCESRWSFIEFCMKYKILNPCRADAYFWSIERDVSVFDLGECNLCRGEAYCYCGKDRNEKSQ